MYRKIREHNGGGRNESGPLVLDMQVSKGDLQRLASITTYLEFKGRI
jgi:hypothetical protein